LVGGNGRRGRTGALGRGSGAENRLRRGLTCARRCASRRQWPRERERERERGREGGRDASQTRTGGRVGKVGRVVVRGATALCRWTNLRSWINAISRTRNNRVRAARDVPSRRSPDRSIAARRAGPSFPSCTRINLAARRAHQVESRGPAVRLAAFFVGADLSERIPGAEFHSPGYNPILCPSDTPPRGRADL